MLVAAGIATLIPSISGTLADAYAALVVSLIILCSLLPLLQGLAVTAIQLRRTHQKGFKLKQDIATAAAAKMVVTALA